MRYRTRLLGIAIASVPIAVVLAVVLAPVGVVLARDVLHLGCDLSSDGSGVPPEWVCPDGIGYVIPALVATAMMWAGAFTVGVLLMLRRAAHHGAGSDLRRAVARDLGWLGAAPLVLQAPVSVLAGVSSAYSAGAIVLGLLVGVAGSLPFLAGTARPWIYSVACLVAAMAAAAVIPPAMLLAPFIAGCASLLVCAAVTMTVGATRARSLPVRSP